MVKVLHYSTHNEADGIAKYQEQFVEAMANDANAKVTNEFFRYSPNVVKRMSLEQKETAFMELAATLKNFDILHIQHELSYFEKDDFNRIVDVAHRLGKKAIVTVHTAPDAQYKTPQCNGYGPSSIVAYMREIVEAKGFINRHIVPMRKADLVLVHNRNTKDNLVMRGVQTDKIHLITLPVPDVKYVPESKEIGAALQKKTGDIIIGMVGFISRTKGVHAAVKALSYLPDHYKLALAGGVHPNGDPRYLDEICDLVLTLGLKERVYITGYIDDDNRLNALVKECDVWVYPYDNAYYQHVSSAALNNSLANHKPTIVYPTKPFMEINQTETVMICKSPNYYELARCIATADYASLAKNARRYAEEHSYIRESKNLVDIYEALVG
ncbi:MAG: glycosyltransferase [Rubrivivax sp.]|nr:glycosyltransferase [Rubrivivax sp.]